MPSRRLQDAFKTSCNIRYAEDVLKTLLDQQMFARINIIRKFSFCLYKIYMKSKNELKEIDIKNRTCYYLDDIIIGAKIKFGKN